MPLLVHLLKILSKIMVTKILNPLIFTFLFTSASNHFTDFFLSDCELHKTSPPEILSYGVFFQYFKKHYSHVKFLKHTHLSKCVMCLSFIQDQHHIKTLVELVIFISFFLKFYSINFINL